MTPLDALASCLALLSDAFFRPGRLRRRATEAASKNRLMFQAFGLLFAVPGGLFLLLLGLDGPTHLAFATTSALDGGLPALPARLT